MIPDHQKFLEAINERMKVRVRFYSIADSGVIDSVCAPMDYGSGDAPQGGLNRYWLWDYKNSTGTHNLSLSPQQIVELHVLNEMFDPAEFGMRPWPWSIARGWGMSGAKATTKS